MTGALFMGSATAAPLYFNGFETDTAGWPSPPTRVASGTAGITSSDGAFHATTAAGSNNFTNWGGYNYGAGSVPTAFPPSITPPAGRLVGFSPLLPEAVEIPIKCAAPLNSNVRPMEL